jgi:hypothetical protein
MSGAAQATTIDFETGAPPGFGSTTPLTTAYSSQGVVFSGLPGSNGGSILDENGGFGINARSGRDFLAFNSPFTGIGEILTFSVAQSLVSIYLGNSGASSFTITAFDGLTQISSTTANTTAGAYGLFSVTGSHITSVEFTSTSSVFVADDLSFTAAPVPEPSTIVLFGAGLFAFGAFRRVRATEKR